MDLYLYNEKRQRVSYTLLNNGSTMYGNIQETSIMILPALAVITKSLSYNQQKSEKVRALAENTKEYFSYAHLLLFDRVNIYKSQAGFFLTPLFETSTSSPMVSSFKLSVIFAQR